MIFYYKSAMHINPYEQWQNSSIVTKEVQNLKKQTDKLVKGDSTSTYDILIKRKESLEAMTILCTIS